MIANVIHFIKVRKIETSYDKDKIIPGILGITEIIHETVQLMVIYEMYSAPIFELYSTAPEKHRW